ncbi:MAG: hypothetical protein LBO00_05485 [Zoogloeaceae bacterium]|nr:hypothetical protein [Zoogloeaceae bacterium]
MPDSSPEDHDDLHCSQHGAGHVAYICEHLANRPEQRWHCDYPTEETPWPDAWCDTCDAALQAAGGDWDDESAPEIKIICHHCYEELQGKSVHCLTPEAHAAWSECLEEYLPLLQGKQARLAAKIKGCDWEYDQETGLLTFSKNGKSLLVAEFESVGSFSSVSRTWLWSWANFTTFPNVRTRITAVRDFGEARDFLPLIIPKWPAELVDAWEVSAFAVHLLHAEGIYRAPIHQGFHFLAIMSIQS